MIDAPADRQRAALVEIVRAHAPLLDDTTTSDVVERVRARMSGLGRLEPLLRDPLVTDVMVNGGGQVWIDRAGRLVRTDLVLDEATTLHLVERVLAPLGRHVDRASPIVDARLADGSRVHAVVRPLAVDGPCLTIRRFGARPIRLDDVASPGVGALLVWAVQARQNVVISGGRVPARQRCSTRWPRRSRPESGSSRSRTPPSCACRANTSCASKGGTARQM